MESWILSSLGLLKWEVKDFSRYFVVTAPFGNYIALVPKDNNDDRDFTMYDGCGHVILEDMFSPSYHVVAAYWLEDQRLCIFLSDCRVIIYSPTNDPRRMVEVFSEEDIESGIKIKTAIVYGVTCFLVTEGNEVFSISEIGETLAKRAPSLPDDARFVFESCFICRKADIKVLGILPDSSISSRNTSIIISVQSGLFKGTIFFINNNSNTTHMLVVGVY